MVLSGHEHSYERFARQTPWAKASRQGIRQFVVGTGGADLLGFAAAEPNSQRRLAGSTALELVLHPASYQWRFVSEDGAVLDKGGPIPATEAVIATRRRLTDRASSLILVYRY